VADGFATDAVLLGGEVEGSVVGFEDAINGGGGSIVGGVADRKGDVAQSEGMRFGVGATLAVLPLAEKEEESQDGQIGDGALVVGGVGVLGDNGLDVDEQLKGDGSHTGGRRVLLVVEAHLMVEAKVGAPDGVVAGIRGPHTGEDLGHGAKVLLHGPLAYRAAVGGKLADPDLVGKDLEDGDLVGDAGKGGVETETAAEFAPDTPAGVVGGGSAGMDASGNRVLAKAVDSPCFCCDVRWSMRQDVACGKERSNRAQSCESERSQRREAASAR
jgi:hypothetical protein